MATLGSGVACALALVAVGAGVWHLRPTAPAVDLKWAALGRTCRADAPAIPLSRAARDSLPPDSSSQHFGRRVGLARALPGHFAGLGTVDGRLALFLTDTSRRVDALAYTRAHGIDGMGLTDDTPVLPARWDYEQLFDWLRYLEGRLTNVSGLVSLGIDEANNRVEFGVVTPDDRGKLEARLRQLGIPCFLVAIEVYHVRPSVGTGA